MLLLVYSFVLVMPILALETNLTVNNFGTITYPPSLSDILVFDDLEQIVYTPTITSSSTCFSNSPISTMKYRLQNDGGGLSVTTERAYSGVRSFKVQRSVHSRNRTQLELLTSADRYRAGQMVFLPLDFALVSPTNKWFALGDPVYEWIDSDPGHEDALYIELHMLGSDLRLYLTHVHVVEGVRSTAYVDTKINMTNYLGSWTKIHWEVYRHETEGYTKLYLNNSLIATLDKNSHLSPNFTGKKPMYITKWIKEETTTQLVKHYCASDEKENTVFFDNLFFENLSVDGG
ncbi:MAG: hypothetical protein ACFFDT_02755 [Candidatus Hodarchaeota archaeon]